MTFEEIKQKINFRQPKYMLPAILYPILLSCAWPVSNLIDTKVEDVPDKNLEVTNGINANMPIANIKGDGIGGRYDNMKNSFGMIADASAVTNIDRNEEEQKEDYESKYSEEELASINAEAARQAELAKQKSTETASQSSREQEALAELERALAQARLQAQATVPPVSTDDDANANTVEGKAEVKGKINLDARKSPTEETEATEVVKKVKMTSDYFNTLSVNEKEPNMIKAIIDENIKAVDGSRVRLRLLDDVEIGETVVRKGSYLYAIMSGFGSQRVKGNVKSVMVDDEIVKINLSLYDTDGLEGLYVPSSSFRETTKDVASGAMSGQMSMNNGTTGNSLAQWGMQAAQNAYQKTSSAISKAIKKNKVSLKYGTFVYLINSKDTKNK